MTIYGDFKNLRDSIKNCMIKDKKNQLWWGHKQQQEQQQGLAWLFNPHHIGIHTQRHHQIGAGLKLMQY